MSAHSEFYHGVRPAGKYTARQVAIAVAVSVFLLLLLVVGLALSHKNEATNTQVNGGVVSSLHNSMNPPADPEKRKAWAKDLKENAAFPVKGGFVRAKDGKFTPEKQ